MIDFQAETNGMELWLPQNGENGKYYQNGKWLQDTFPSNPNNSKQLFKIMFEGNNKPLSTISNIDSTIHILNTISSLSSPSGEKSYPAVCTKLWSSVTNGTECLEHKLVYFFANHRLDNLDAARIINDRLNEFWRLLGNNGTEWKDFYGPLRNLSSIASVFNYTEDILSKMTVLDIAFETGISQHLLMDIKRNYSRKDDDLTIQFLVPDRIEKYITEDTFRELNLLIGGFALVLLYVMMMIGKFNSLEQRIYLSFLGIISIAFGAGMSLGFCQLIGQKFGPIHYLLPFLFLGIGIDDIFVIVQGLQNVKKDDNQRK